MSVHSILPDPLTRAAAAALEAAGVRHVAHGTIDPLGAAALAAADPRALVLLRSLGGFDRHGDPPEPPVWLWRADAAWALRPDRPL